jgi:hypothetical protein
MRSTSLLQGVVATLSVEYQFDCTDMVAIAILAVNLAGGGTITIRHFIGDSTIIVANAFAVAAGVPVAYYFTVNNPSVIGIAQAAAAANAQIGFLPQTLGVTIAGANTRFHAVAYYDD